MTNTSCFIQNKYYRLYARILATHSPLPSEYTEIHHIIPKSLGGSNDKNNLKKVSSRVHFICHYLLTKFTTGNEWYAMVKAFSLMKASKYSNRYMNSRLYEANRKNMSVVMSAASSGSRNSQYGKIWMTNKIIEITKKVNADQINEAIEQGWIVGRNANYKTVKLKKRLTHCNQKELESFHELYIFHGFATFKELTGYKFSQANLVMRFKKYIPDFVPQMGKQRTCLLKGDCSTN